MAKIKFTEKNPPANNPAKDSIYNVTTDDLVSDPMTISGTANGFDFSGAPVSNPYNRSFAKVDYTGTQI